VTGFPYNPLNPHSATAGALTALGPQVATPPGAPPVIIVPPGASPMVLLAHWEADAPGTVDVDSSGVQPYVTEWRDKINGYKIRQTAGALQPHWIPASTMVSARPAIGFAASPEYLLGDATLLSKLKSLSGMSITLLAAVDTPVAGTLYRNVYLDTGATPRFAYSTPNFTTDRFYGEGATAETDPYVFATGGVQSYVGWATHTMRRDYLNGKLDIFWNGQGKVIASDFGIKAVGSATTPTAFYVGSGVAGESASIMHLHAIKLYTKYITDSEMNADAAYFGGRINA